MNEAAEAAEANILIVEDEADVARVYQEALEHWGYRVIGIEASGEKALGRLADATPDLVLMDIHLGGRLDGIATARIIKQEFGIPIIFLTGSGGGESVRRAREVEPLGYLIKPFSLDQLLVAVDIASTHARAETRFRRDYEARLRELEERLKASLEALSSAPGTASGGAPGATAAGTGAIRTDAPAGGTPWWRTDWHRTMDAFPSPMFVVDRQANVLSYNEAALRVVFSHRGLILATDQACDFPHEHPGVSAADCRCAPLSRNCSVREAVERAFEGIQTRDRTVRFTLPQGEQGSSALITSRVSAAPLDRDVALLLIEPTESA
jgi:CheY-like chemotaxis protein